LQAGGTTTVIAGTLIPAIGFFVLPLAVALIVMLKSGRIDKSSIPLVAGVAAFLLLTSVVTTPVFIIVSLIPWGIAGLVVAWLIGLFMRSNRGKASKAIIRSRARISSSEFLISVITVWAAGNFFFFVSNNVPWVPAERIVSTSGHPFTGYIFGETDTDVSLLKAGTYQIIHLTPQEIVSRTVCRPSGIIYSGFYIETLSELIGGHNNSNYPVCPG
jgi:hypothetical protein